MILQGVLEPSKPVYNSIGPGLSLKTDLFPGSRAKGREWIERRLTVRQWWRQGGCNYASWKRTHPSCTSPRFSRGRAKAYCLSCGLRFSGQAKIVGEKADLWTVERNAGVSCGVDDLWLARCASGKEGGRGRVKESTGQNDDSIVCAFAYNRMQEMEGTKGCQDEMVWV